MCIKKTTYLPIFEIFGESLTLHVRRLMAKKFFKNFEIWVRTTPFPKRGRRYPTTPHKPRLLQHYWLILIWKALFSFVFLHNRSLGDENKQKWKSPDDVINDVIIENTKKHLKTHISGQKCINIASLTLFKSEWPSGSHSLSFRIILWWRHQWRHNRKY